jgi:hypothetical protein
MTTEELISVIYGYFGDTSRSPGATEDGLIQAKEHIEILIESLEEPCE